MTSVAPAISVVIPCHNLGLYVEEAVRSVLAQTLSDFEITIVDDGSTDEATLALLRTFDLPKTRVLAQQNRGVGAARNRGIRESLGRYVCCLDADDRLRCEFFEKAFSILEARPEVGLVTGYFQMFGEKTDVFRYQSCSIPEMLVYNQAVEPAVFRREAWEKAGGYCETFSSSGIEDWDLWIAILELGFRAEVICDVVWDYRIRRDQMSTKMYQSSTWQQLCSELVMRHKQTYMKYVGEIVSQYAARSVELREWAEARGRAVDWWEKQAKNWQQTAEENQRKIKEQQAWIAQLEKDKAWLEEQRNSWQRLAGERDRLIQEYQGKGKL
jgi:glycosyltransferase involved in cell wall biosynthesis